MSAAPAASQAGRAGRPFTIELPTEIPDVEPLRKELAAFQKCVQGNPERLNALCAVMAVCGSDKDSTFCKPTTEQQRRKAAMKIVSNIINGAELNGEDDNWSVGFLGSRWMDTAAAPFGLDYVRAAFYSKKTYRGEWLFEEPYAIQVMCEKAR